MYGGRKGFVVLEAQGRARPAEGWSRRGADGALECVVRILKFILRGDYTRTLRKRVVKSDSYL